MHVSEGAAGPGSKRPKVDGPIVDTEKMGRVHLPAAVAKSRGEERGDEVRKGKKRRQRQPGEQGPACDVALQAEPAPRGRA